MSDDSFWGWLKDATALAGELLMLVLLAAESEKPRRVSAISFGDATGCYFDSTITESSKSVNLHNELDSYVCCCTFTSVSNGSVHVDYVEVQPHESSEVTSYLNTCVANNGSVALVTAPPGSNGAVPASIVCLRDFSLQTQAVFQQAGITFTPGPESMDIDATGSHDSYNVTAEFEFAEGRGSFTSSVQVAQGNSATMSYPDGFDETAVLETLTVTLVALQSAPHLATIGDGEYFYIESEQCGGMVLTAEADNSIQLQGKAGAQAQQWTLTPTIQLAVAKPFIGFQITPANNVAKALTYDPNSQAVQLAAADSTNPNQAWLVIGAGQDNLLMIAAWPTIANTGAVLDLANGSCSPGTRVISYGSHGVPWEQWRLDAA